MSEFAEGTVEAGVHDARALQRAWRENLDGITQMLLAMTEDELVTLIFGLLIINTPLTKEGPQSV